MFTVTNTGSQSDGYTFTCAGSANVSCTGVSPSSVFLNSLQSTTVTAFYSVGTVGDGTVSLTASGTFDSDQGWYTIPVGTYGVAVTPDGTPEPTRRASTGGYSAIFTVRNTPVAALRASQASP